MKARLHPQTVDYLEGLLEGFVAYDENWVMTYMNAAGERLLGRRREEVLGKTWHQAFPHAAGNPVDQMYQRVMRTRQPERMEYRYPHYARWFEISASPVRSGGVAVYFRDISDREELNRIGRALAAELDLERLVQAVTDAATELAGARFGAFFYNVKDEAGESYTLYTLSGAPREAFARFGMPRNTAVFAPTFAGEGIVRLDDVTRDPRYGRNPPHRGMPEGHLPVRSYLAAPVVSRSGEVLGGLFFGHPEPAVFTERAERMVAGIAAQAAVAIDNARLYAESRRLVEELREADRRKDEFIATLSHELRNPLAPLRNALHLLRLSGRDAHAAPIHEMMERQLDHLVRLVDDLLESARITRGAFELRREPVEIAALVRNALETAEAQIRAGGQRVSMLLPQEALWVDGDPVRLAQILANLLNNAAKFTARGGSIELHARRAGDAALVSVRDDGAGIAPDELPHLFDMFRRAGRSGGLGIGLALARRLAEMHGGALEASSAGPGRGAEFTVRLPLAKAQDPPGTRRSEAHALPQKRILVVDDNRDAADSLGALLRLLGAEVQVAHRGRDAVAAFDSYRPAVVLLDIGMPDMDGYQVARALRARDAGRSVPIVALTGWGQEEDRRRAREAGFDHHLVKPPDLAALRSLLASL